MTVQSRATVIACDLDQTLIYSSRALRLSVPDREAPAMLSVEVIDGRPQSFMTLAATQLLTELSANQPFVPCTTRTIEQFQRVKLPLAASSTRYAVTSNGGNLLVDGKPDRDWRQALDARLLESASPLDEVSAELLRRSDADWVIKRRSADHLFCYLVVDLARVPAGFLEEWGEWCREHGWLLSVQGRKVYSTPVGLRKSAAIAEVAQRTGATRLLAAGDGLLDAEMLELADAGIRPGHGELAQLGWSRDHVKLTVETGVMAGEEIVRWFSEQVTDS